MIARPRHRVGDESGVVMVIVAITLVALLGFAALAIDVGSFYQAQRQAQAAADAGALAGADDVYRNTTAITSDATSYAKTNAPSTNATISVSQPTLATVKVTVSASSPSFFGRFLGLTAADVSATAVASAKNSPATCTSTTGQCDAIFAKSQSCTSPPIQITTGGVTINGAVHSNGSLTVTGGNDTISGPAEYGSSCPPPVPASNQQYIPVATAPINQWPIDYTLQYPACTGSACTGLPSGSGTPPYCTQSAPSFPALTPVSGQVYCAYGTGSTVIPGDPSTWTGAISLSVAGSATSPIQATYIGGSITVPSTAQAYFAPCVIAACSSSNQLLFYAATGNISLSGGGSGVISGDMFAPNGSIAITGGGQSVNFLEAQTVSIQGGNFTGDGPQYVPGQTYVGPVVSLIQ